MDIGGFKVEANPPLVDFTFYELLFRFDPKYF